MQRQTNITVFHFPNPVHSSCPNIPNMTIPNIHNKPCRSTALLNSSELEGVPPMMVYLSYCVKSTGSVFWAASILLEGREF